MFTVRNRRAWIRFTQAGAILLAVVAVALVVYHVQWAHERRAFLTREQATWEAKGASRRYIISQEECRPPLFLRLIGERGYDAVFVAIDVTSLAAFTDAHRNRLDEVRHLFPESRVHTIYLDNDVDGGIRIVTVDPSLDETSELTAFVKNLRSGDWW
jgi:hypothetical protein